MIVKDSRRAALERQIARLERGEAALARRSDRLSNLRLWLVVLGLPAVWGAFLLLKFWPGLILLAALVVVFGGVVARHHRVAESQADHGLYRAIKTRHVARITLDWAAIPPPFAAEVSPAHPFATDLDLVGPASLHRLIDTAATREGRQRLLDWLTAPLPDPATIARRQALLRELIPLTRFRDRLVLAAARADRGLSAEWSGQRLLDRLAAGPSPAAIRPTLRALLALAATNVILVGLHAAGLLPPLWSVTVLAYIALTLRRRDLVGDLFEDALYLADALRRLGAVLGFLERYPYGRHPGLRALCAPLLAADARPSAILRRVSRVASAASLQGNPFLWLPLNLLLPWDVLFAERLSHHRAALLRLLPAWLEVWYELEALNSLATFAYLNPEYTFPQITPEADPPALVARRIGHPLIPYRDRVCNDFSLRRGEIVIITGSNMSGKSAFLRTIGINMALAYAGSVVNAEALTLSPFRLFTCIRVTDSVVDGISYFYAEVKRLRALLDALDAVDAPPLLALIDEIFRGTNNRERLIGSQAYIRALGERGATGLVSTHDLELIHLAETLPAVRNQHFRESVADGRMHFDYTLRPGPSPTTNALVIMQMEGLPVGE